MTDLATLRRWLRHDPNCAASVVDGGRWPVMLIDRNALHERCDCGLMEAVDAAQTRTQPNQEDDR